MTSSTQSLNNHTYINQLRQQIINANRNNNQNISNNDNNNSNPNKFKQSDRIKSIYSKERLKALDESIQSIQDHDL